MKRAQGGFPKSMDLYFTNDLRTYSQGVHTSYLMDIVWYNMVHLSLYRGSINYRTLSVRQSMFEKASFVRDFSVYNKSGFRDHRWLQHFCRSSVQTFPDIPTFVQTFTDVSRKKHTYHNSGIFRHIKVCPDRSRRGQTYQDMSRHMFLSTLSLASCTCPPAEAWSISPGDQILVNFCQVMVNMGTRAIMRNADGWDFKFLPVFVSWAPRWYWADQIELWTGPGAGRCLSPATWHWLFFVFLIFCSWNCTIS